MSRTQTKTIAGIAVGISSVLLMCALSPVGRAIYTHVRQGNPEENKVILIRARIPFTSLQPEIILCLWSEIANLVPTRSGTVDIVHR